jgi:hypothetical protein
MGCIIAELLLFSITLAVVKDNRRQDRVLAVHPGAELAGVMHLLFKSFRANMKILDSGKKRTKSENR